MKSEIQRRTFTNFATSTTLHGWRYFTDRPLHWFDCVFWVLVLAAVYIIGIQFVVSNTRQYLDATIQTTIESTTTPLSEVYFPAVTLCNINQVCFKWNFFSFLLELKIFTFKLTSAHPFLQISGNMVPTWCLEHVVAAFPLIK